MLPVPPLSHQNSLTKAILPMVCINCPIVILLASSIKLQHRPFSPPPSHSLSLPPPLRLTIIANCNATSASTQRTYGIAGWSSSKGPCKQVRMFVMCYFVTVLRVRSRWYSHTILGSFANTSVPHATLHHLLLTIGDWQHYGLMPVAGSRQ